MRRSSTSAASPACPGLIDVHTHILLLGSRTGNETVVAARLARRGGDGYGRSPGGESPLRTLVTGTVSRRQGRRREAGSAPGVKISTVRIPEVDIGIISFTNAPSSRESRRPSPVLQIPRNGFEKAHQQPCGERNCEGGIDVGSMTIIDQSLSCSPSPATIFVSGSRGFASGFTPPWSFRRIVQGA